MNEIKLKRGTREVTFKKLPEYFAVRLKQGRAADEVALEAACGRPKAETCHIDSAATEKMDIFAVREAGRLEETMDELRIAPASDVITHMYAMDDAPDSGVIPTGTMTILFKSGTTHKERENILEEHGLEVLEDLDFIPNGYTVGLTDASTENPLKIAAHLQEECSEIVTAEPDLNFQISFKYTPRDDLYPYQWHLKNRGNGYGLAEGADVKAEKAWDITRGRRNIVVCVMDDGFDLGHPDFDAVGKIVAPRDFAGEDSDPSPGLRGNRHGTACAGVAIAEENGTGVVGLAPDCGFMPVRISGRLSDESIKNLFQYAIDQNADVISCSWGAGAWNFPLSAKMYGIIRKAATQGREYGKGCVILFAAGNENRPLDGEKDGRISHQGFALHPNVIAVGASNSLDIRSPYSNYGQALSLCAPSNGRPGRPIVTTDRRGAMGYSPYDYTGRFGGTSSATPLAAGLAALILSLNPDLTSSRVKDIMEDTADKIDRENGEYKDGHSPWYGHGRINAQRATERVASEKPPRALCMEHRINQSISGGDGIEDAIPFPLNVDIQDLEVFLKIRPGSGDLRVNLIPPEGDEISLIDRTAGGQDNISRNFRASDDPELFGEMMGTSAEGEWRLKVMPLEGQNGGQLVKWRLTVVYQ